jgi:threonine/homoserine/homoserine lactone efflux protein
LSKYENSRPEYRPRSVFRDVFLVNALNPKGIIFFNAFMPQLVDPAGSIMAQPLVLGTTFLALAFINVMGYSLLAGQMALFFKKPPRMRMFKVSGGLCMICAGFGRLRPGSDRHQESR